MRYRLLMAMLGSLLATATLATAEQIGTLLTGYEEAPAVSTTGTGEFTATIAPDGEVIQYTETYSGLQGAVTQSLIHVGQLGVYGSIVIFLCQTAANPDPTGLAPPCPQEGTVSGTITGIDHGIGHFMFFEVDSEARALDPPSPKSPQTSSAASDRKSALLPSSHPAGSGKSCEWW